MIGVSSSGRSFSGLAAYLRFGRSGRELDRVDWSAGRNLPTDDIELAGKIMRETAAQNRRVRDALYHVVLSFDRRDTVTRDQMEAVVDRVLVALKLADHQALLVAHRDRAHAHVHVMVNRIHPDTHRAWDRWRDMVTIQEALRTAERELGLAVTPGRLAVGRERAEHTHGRTEHGDAGQRSAHAPLETQPSVLGRAREQLAEWRSVASWTDLAAQLERVGLWLEMRARGAVVTDGEQFVRASRVAPDCSGPALQDRFGGPPPPPSEDALQKAEAIARAIRQYVSIEAAGREGYDAAARVAGARHRSELVDAAAARADDAWRAFDQALRMVFHREEAVLRIRAELARLGALVTPEAARDALTREAERVRREHAIGSRGTPRSPVERESFDKLVLGARQAGISALSAERDLEILSEALKGARKARGLSPAGEHANRTQDAAPSLTQMRQTFAALYAEPERALERFEVVRAARGGVHAVRLLSSEPEELGAVRPDALEGRGLGTARMRAASTAQAHLEATSQLASERDLAHRELEHADRAAKIAAERRRQLPPRSVAHPALRRVVASLKTAEMAVLHPLLAIPERAVLRTVRQAAREVALGRSSDVER